MRPFFPCAAKVGVKACHFRGSWKIAGVRLCGVHENMVIHRLMEAGVIEGTHSTAYPDIKPVWAPGYRNEKSQRQALKKFVPQVYR